MTLKQTRQPESGFQFADEQEKRMMIRFEHDYSESKSHFLDYRKDRFDKFYKLYRAYTGDRAKLIKSWQSNLFIPYIFSVVETLLPRIIDSRPAFTVIARTKKDIEREHVVQQVLDYVWEVSKMDSKNMNFVKDALIYGTSVGKTRWEKRYSVNSILTSIEEESGELLPKYEQKTKVLYDNPQFDNVSVYDFLPDKHASGVNNGANQARFVYERTITTKDEILSQYPKAKNLQYVSARKFGPYGSVDTTDFKLVRKEVLANRNQIYTSSGGDSGDTSDLLELVQRWEGNRTIVRANGFPIINIPNPYSHNEIPYTVVRYVEMPGEMYGIGIPESLENLQIMLNTIKNQRIDNVTLSIHKMWIVDPLSNINKNDLITKPFGIIYSNNPSGVKAVEFTDIKASAYTEEDRLKDDMRNATGVDDYSRGVGGGAGSATEASFLREATLERVRLFLRGLESSYEDIMRQWFSLIVDFFPEKKEMRVIKKEDGSRYYPLIKKDDYKGEFDFKVGANSTVAASKEVQKEQIMGVAQILLQLPEVDRRNVISELANAFGYDKDYLLKSKEKQAAEGAGADPTEALMEGQMPGGAGLPPALLEKIKQQQGGTVQGNTVPDVGKLQGENSVGNSVDQLGQQGGIIGQ